MCPRAVYIHDLNTPINDELKEKYDLVEILYTPESLREVLILSGFDPAHITIKEEVAYSPDELNFLKKLLKKFFLPIITKVVDMIWYLFFISQGSAPKKNRPVILAVCKNKSL